MVPLTYKFSLTRTSSALNRKRQEFDTRAFHNMNSNRLEGTRNRHYVDTNDLQPGATGEVFQARTVDNVHIRSSFHITIPRPANDHYSSINHLVARPYNNCSIAWRHIKGFAIGRAGSSSFEDLRTTHSLDGLISKVYPYQDLARAINNPSFFFESAILTTRNNIVDKLNQKRLDLLPGEEITSHSADTADTSNEENDEVHPVSSEYLDSLNPGNFPPANLRLKRGCIIVLLPNINPKIRLCNGTRLIVNEIGAYILKVSVSNYVNDEVEQI
ncbi:hypothetical protein [Parasitella parasitica]|uniref:DNA helicase Pif1-like 2B domain-containing protein n=1 Tax=Parasitella parasitica TaxID=35722 RepID=A0A0B7NK28_9FUNG|nr:hypothetical protein [Parasitella parasitica]